MSDLYSLNEATETLTTATCRFVGSDMLHTNGNVYEVVIADLCRCLCAAIEVDDTLGKRVISMALHTVLSSVLEIE